MTSSRRNAIGLLIGWLLWTGPALAQPTGYQYFYDDSGQLVKVVDSSGIVVEYVYDDSGNRLEVRRFTAAGLAVFALTPRRGVPGTAVRIQGQHFDPTPAMNTVTFNGTPADVLAASFNFLDVTVPATATTGPVAVTVGGTTALSTDNFTVLRIPRIDTISPVIAASDAAVPVVLSTVTAAGADFSGATFSFLPELVPPTVVVTSAVVDPGGTSVTLDVRLEPNAAGTFTLVGENGAGSSDNVATGMNTLLVLRGAWDEDGDGLDNAGELAVGTDPFQGDTDGDGFGDPDEISAGSDPLDPAGRPADPQGSAGETASLVMAVLNAVLPAAPDFPREISTTRSFSVLNTVTPPDPGIPGEVSTTRSFSILNTQPPPAATFQHEAWILPLSILNTLTPAEASFPREANAAPVSIENNP